MACSVQQLLQIFSPRRSNSCLVRTFNVFAHLLLRMVLIAFLCAVTVLSLCIVIAEFLCLIAISSVLCLFLRLLQLALHGDTYVKSVQVKFILRITIMYSCMGGPLLVCILFPIAKYVPKVNQVMLSGLHLTVWTNIIAMITLFICFAVTLGAAVHFYFPLLPLSHNESGINNRESLSEIFDCFILWWAEIEVMKRFPAFKTHQILGLHTQKWIEVPIFVVIGCNIITISTHLILYGWEKLSAFIEHFMKDDTPSSSNSGYISVEERQQLNVLISPYELKSNINFIFNSVLILLTWVLYFGSHLNKTPQAKRVLSVGNATCLTILILAFFWLIKKCLLVIWKANQIFSKQSGRILEARTQLYFLGILGRLKYDFFELRNRPSPAVAAAVDVLRRAIRKVNLRSVIDGGRSDDEESRGNNRRYNVLGMMSKFLGSVKGNELSRQEDDEMNPFGHMRWRSKKWKTVGDHLLMRQMRLKAEPSLGDTKRMAEYFVAAHSALSNQNYVSDILEKIGTVFSSPHHGNTRLEHCFKQLINCPSKKKKKVTFGSRNSYENEDSSKQQDWDNFMSSLNMEINGSPNEESCDDNLKLWMDKAHKNCLAVANNLRSAQEVGDCLNKIMSGILVFGTFIVWLLVTGFASTKVLVLIGSPLLAATFIFGNTCKNLFEGVLFVYVQHPFSVGDLCVIDGEMLQVKFSNVWKTTFSHVATEEEIIYPNTELANKKVINHKTDYDWNDCLEFHLPTYKEEKVETLKKTIERYLYGEEKIMQDSLWIEVLANQDKLKMAVHFKHKKRAESRTFWECFKQKQESRSQILFCIKPFFDQVFKDNHQGSERKMDHGEIQSRD